MAERGERGGRKRERIIIGEFISRRRNYCRYYVGERTRVLTGSTLGIRSCRTNCCGEGFAVVDMGSLPKGPKCHNGKEEKERDFSANENRNENRLARNLRISIDISEYLLKFCIDCYYYYY